MEATKDYIEAIEGAERRCAVMDMTVEKRTEKRDDGDVELHVVRGYAALFNVRAVIWGWFEEEIMEGAFDDVLDDDVRCLFNHDPNQVLARCIEGKGTLSIGVDKKGLWYEYVTPQRSYALDLADAIDKGDVSQSSFSWKPKEQVWIEREGEMDLRQITKFERLYDVSPVTYPAYQETTVSKRSQTAYQDAKKEMELRSGENKGLTTYEAQLMVNKNKK